MVRFTTFLFSLALLVGYQTAFAEKTRVGGSCENTYTNDEDCEYWADQGYCSSSSEYSDWMEDNCEQSCNMCGICRNIFHNDEWCESWADSGYCSSSSQYSDWMEMYCEQSCNMCSPSAAPVSAPSAAPTTCMDTWDANDTCEYAAGQGDCLYPPTSREWMETNCELTCKMCTGVPSCENAYADDDACEDWAHHGDCYKPASRDWMFDNCRKSCKMCCEDPYDTCQQWADRGDCSSSSKYSDWMAKNCPITCSSTPCIS